MKRFLVISAKQAVGAVVGNTALAALFPHTFHLHDWTGIAAFAKAALAFVAAAEAKVWLPKLLQWANSATNGQ
jgi:hypothetical protein